MKAPVAIFGSSFIGALRKWTETTSFQDPDFTIEFMATSGAKTPVARVEDGRVVDFKYSSAPDGRRLSDYVAIFLYARMPTPLDIAARYKAARESGCSRQVILAMVRDSLEESPNLILFRRIREAFHGQIYLVSSNIPSDVAPPEPGDYQLGVSLIREVLGDKYHEFPSEMFNRDLTPRLELYKGSVTYNGEAPTGDQSKHDRNHLNPEGGSIVLRSMVARLARPRSQKQAWWQPIATMFKKLMAALRRRPLSYASA